MAKPVSHKGDPAAKPAGEAGPAPFGLDRLVFFSDAVIAIAITLLVLDIKFPETVNSTNLTAEAIAAQVAALWPKFLGYLVSFWVIALYWVAHHRCFRYIRAYDRRLIYLNFLFLMFVAFMPFPTGLLFNSRAVTVTVALYAGTAAGMGLSLAFVWLYATGHKFTQAGLSPVVVRDIRLNLLLPPLVFLASAALALFNAGLAMYTWFLLIPVYALRRYSEQKLMGREMR